MKFKRKHNQQMKKKLMSLLKERLADIDKQPATQRKNRGRIIRVTLIGYTNVGKSTMMNLLSKSEVFAENKLFATLDTTVIFSNYHFYTKIMDCQ